MDVNGTLGLSASEYNFLEKHGREQEEQLICESLVCEIRDAKRWIAVVEAWQALLAVRRMAEALRDKRREEDAASGIESKGQRGGG